jgi:tRNA dimethylallyltransferase
VIVVLGTNASGKSSLGVALARRFSGEIISADSRQVYTGLDLGTGKLTEEEMRGVPHHLIDVADPAEDVYSVVDFQRDARRCLSEIVARGNSPMIVGGTGLYIRSVVRGYVFPEVRPDPALRRELAGLTVPELLARLRAIDPVSAETIASDQVRHPTGRRLIRAVELAGAGAPLRQNRVEPPGERFLLLGLTWRSEELRHRIEDRLRARIAEGMIDEVSALRTAGLSDEKLHGFGLEYRYVLQYLQGAYGSLAEFEAELARAIVRFAKRQMSWYRKDEGIRWLRTDPGGDYVAEAVTCCEEFLAAERHS